MTILPVKRNPLQRSLVRVRWRSVGAGVMVVLTFVLILPGDQSTLALAQQEQSPSPATTSAAPSKEHKANSNTANTQPPTTVQETERQKEQRLAVEQERAARGATVKDLKTKLAEADKSASNEPLQLTFDDLVFPMDKNDHFQRSMLSKDHDRLNDRRIRISGYIRPSARQTGLDKFVFVRDNMQCCFGPGAALFDCILVKMADGKATDYTVRPVTIEGDFYIKEFTGPNGKTWAVFRMKNGQVK